MVRALFLSFFISFLAAFSQDGPRTWKDHTSLNWSNSVTKFGSKIYASNGVGVVRFDEEELAPQSLTKISGLHDIGVRLVRTNNYNNKLLVVYDNCNIDIIDANENIKNYADFKLKAFNGKKTVNEITYIKQFAYLACGFGIVLFDTDKLEIKETFFIGPNGSNLEVYQVALNDSLIFAATPNGIYRSNHKTKNLNNFNSWQLDTTLLPPGPYSGVINCDGKIMAAYSPFKMDVDLTMRDTMYILDNSNIWKKFNPSEKGYTIKKFCTVSGELYSYIDQFGIIVRNVNTAMPLNYVTSFNGNPVPLNPNDLCFSIKTSRNLMTFWVADDNFGLFQTYGYHPYDPQTKVFSNGLNQSQAASIDIYNGKVAVAPSRPDETGGSSYTQEGVNVYKDQEWSYYRYNDFQGNPIKDIDNVLIDRVDTSRMWAASWSSGLLRYTHNILDTIYDAYNSGITQISPFAPRISGLAMDKEGNLWFSNSDVKNYLGVVKKNGSMQNFDFSIARFTRKIMIDRNNYVWCLHERSGGITVYKADNFTTPALGVNYKILTKDIGSGNIQSDAVHSIAEDKEGRIWVGTAAGVVVFYNPTAIFNSSSFDAQPIKIVQDGNVELLLGKEVVSSIVVDGANNKWMGTMSGGVYCFSPDGLTQLYHFTELNSPLYSNYVTAINYDETTGDVFFATDRGLQSFRGVVREGDEKYNNVYAYPNPVRPNYRGTVLVNGLMDNSSVKIVDEGGNLAWETKSKGGQIEWPVTNFSGSRVAPGVYVVYASLTDGSQKAVTKILVVN